MNTVNDFVKSLQRPESSIATISRILSSIDSQVLSNWISKAAVKDGKITGTYYAEIKEKLSQDDFDSLYEALGYNPANRAIWMDWWCYGALGCRRQSGYTCDTSTCTT